MSPKGHHKELLDQLLGSNDFSFPDSAKEKIILYIELLLKWNKTINLTAHRTVEEVLEKDIIDSMYLNHLVQLILGSEISPPLSIRGGWEGLSNLDFHNSPQPPLILRGGNQNSPKLGGIFKESDCQKKILDMGCGAGFSGIVLAILNPHFSIGFLDSDRKKINFCKQAVRELGLQKRDIAPIFIQGRAENHPPEYTHYFNATVTRATWRFHEYIKHAQNYVQNSGQIIWLAGKNEKESYPEILDRQGEGEGGIIDYQIKPKNYKRKIFFFQKNPPQSFT